MSENKENKPKKTGRGCGLIPFNQMDPELRHKIKVMGGKAAVESKRKRKALAAQLDALLKLPVKKIDAKKSLNRLGIDADDQDNVMLMAVGLWKRAITGDPASVKLITEVLGENIFTQNEEDSKVTIEFVVKQPEGNTNKKKNGQKKG